jgi:uncharacterized membrane protein
MPTPDMKSARVAELDIARAIALCAMVVYHFAFDLELFGLITPGTVSGVFWRSFAILTAASFLMIAGISLWIAHGGGIRWPSFVKRFVIICLAAAAVSAATYVAMPDRFVHFGILHCIAVSSLAGLVFLREPAAVLILLAAFVFWLPGVYRDEMFNAPWLIWTGLATYWPVSIDYEPFFPWFAPFLLGIAVAKGLKRWKIVDALASRSQDRSPLARGLMWVGRNSLLIYLLHQPLLLALVWGAAQVIAVA